MNKFGFGAAAFALSVSFASVPFAAVAQTPLPEQETKNIPMDTAVLRALDKVAAHVQTLKVPVGQPVGFGRLEILVKSCFTHPPEETPESTALLYITKTNAKPKAGVITEKTVVFDGWMFASSPGLSAMDDPVYDIWVLDCENSASSSSP